MKNSYVILVVVLVAALALFFGFKSKNLEAPIDVNNFNNDAVSEEVPILDTLETEKESTEEGTTTEEVQMIKEFTVSGENFSFKPNLIVVKKGDKVKITFKNTAGFHDLVIEKYGVATKQGKAPAEEVLEFTADKAGNFQFYCSVGSHRAQGMFGTLRVE